MIDSHCHLADAKFDADLEAVIDRARAVGIESMIAIADSISESNKCIHIAEKFEHIFCSVGVHPHASKDWKTGDSSQVKKLAASSKKVKAIGEIGLDYHYDFSPRDVQRSVFREQLLIANDLGLPVVVHCRNAVEEVWEIVDDVQPKKLVIHCCTEAWKDVDRFVERGYLLSFTGIATYKNAEAVRDCIRRCPIDRLMIETDSPYLAPVPHRGKRNEPQYVAEVAALVAVLKGLSLADVDTETTRNAVEFFGLPE